MGSITSLVVLLAGHDEVHDVLQVSGQVIDVSSQGLGHGDIGE